MKNIEALERERERERELYFNPQRIRKNVKKDNKKLMEKP